MSDYLCKNILIELLVGPRQTCLTFANTQQRMYHTKIKINSTSLWLFWKGMFGRRHEVNIKKYLE